MLFMSRKNKRLFEKVIEDRLTVANDETVPEEERDAAFDDAMKALDRSNEASKTIVKAVEVAAIPVALALLKIAANSRLATRCFEFDLSDTPSSTPGRAFLPSLFRSKD